jgi:hypothetical protein
MFILFFQLPPTPTPPPPPDVVPLEIPTGMFWGPAPEAVGIWNLMNQVNFFTMVQVFMVSIMVILFLGLLYRVLRQMSK